MNQPPKYLRTSIRRRYAPRGFTLIELLVVMVIMAVLISAVVTATGMVFKKAKETNTQATLTVVQEAVQQFKREQTANPTLTRARQGVGAAAVRYSERYGQFPPDELEVFTEEGLPGAGAAGYTLAVGGASIYPPPGGTIAWSAMNFYKTNDPAQDSLEHRDLAAMIVAIELFGDASSSMLGGLPERARSAGPLDAAGAPALFLDRNDDGSWDRDDLQIRYIIDSWGAPLGYFAQRDWDPDAPPEPSTNHPAWNEASTEFIRLNGGQPVIMSYGANGKEQLKQEWMAPEASVTAAASLVGDFEQASGGRHRISHHLNADNLYADPTLKEKLATGIPP